MTTRLKLALWIALATPCALCAAQAGDVTARFTAPTTKKLAGAPKEVVLWLTPVDDAGGPLAARSSASRGTFRLLQKDKMFSPHLLVVPAGASVDFPNADPFFHNVFSLFNGKRFDLGLYEAGTHRSVKFDREGVSYIFCNIHPEMGAIILSVNSPYFGVSDALGTVTIRGVAPGRYAVHIWAEQYKPDASSPHLIQVGPQGAALGPVALSAEQSPLLNHKNKFGEDYPPVPAPKY